MLPSRIKTANKFRLNNPVISSINMKESLGFKKTNQSRWELFLFAVDIFKEFIKGFRELHFNGPCITIFGSARFNPESKHYQQTVALAANLSKLGFAIMTGGGPGIMEAGNRGAREAGGLSLGCNIVLPHEQMPNPYLDRFTTMKYFFVRKELLRRYSNGFVVFPGGLGSLDEFVELITLIQNKKIENFPVVVFNKEYHQHLIKYLDDLIKFGAVSEGDYKMVLFTDDIDEAVDHIAGICPIKNVPKKRIRKYWILGEK